MCLTNTYGNDLTVLPTHRLVSGIAGFDADRFMRELNEDFELTIENPERIPLPQAGRKASFGIITSAGHCTATLRPGREHMNHWPFPQQVRDLDLTILHHFIIEKVLGIPGPRQRSAPELAFERDAAVCHDKVRNGLAQAALLTNPVPIDSILSVCASGSTLPQKSTYFYPKMVSGLVFSSVLPEENPLPDLSGFH